jgi:hypothetical protein
MHALSDCLLEAERSPPRKKLSSRLPDSQSKWAESIINVIKDSSKDDTEFGLRILLKHTISGQKVLHDLVQEALSLFHLYFHDSFPSFEVREHKVFSSCADYYSRLQSRDKPDFLRCFASQFTLSELHDLGFNVSEKNCRTARKRETPDRVPASVHSTIAPEEYRDAVDFLEAISQPSRKWKWLHSFLLLLGFLFSYFFRTPHIYSPSSL